MKTRFFLILAVTVMVAPLFAQYRMEPVGSPAPDLAPAFQALVEPQGYRILDPAGKAYCEVWFRKSLPEGAKSNESAVAFPGIPHGTLLGIIRFPASGADRRGQTLKPGVYTMRYSLHPVDGDHQGVAPQRDFALLTPVAEDKDAAATPNYQTLVEWSRKASGTPHPAVLEMGAPSGANLPSFAAQGERDWVLNVKIGGTAVSFVLVGKSEA
jgi:hypothetical protein